MKKILMLFAAAALVLGAASCQKENFQKALAEGQEQIDYSDDPMGTIKVYIKKDDTKMDFTETDGTLSRKWKVEDVIDGTSVDAKDSKYKAFQYTVMEAVYNVEKPYIVLAKTGGDKGVPSAAKDTRIHFVYAQGAVVSFNEENGTCTLDLSNQDEAHIPAVAVASGDVTIEGGKPHLALDFTPVAAVLAIKANPTLKDFDESNTMSGTFDKVSVSALTKGTMEIEGGEFVLKSATEGTATVTGVDCTKDIFAAVLPGNCTIKAKILDVKNGDTRIGSFGYEKSNVAVAADKYLRIKTDKSFTRIPVATIETTNYATVDDAVDAANEATDDVTIKMLEDDATAEEKLNINNTGSKKITIDLNGKTIGAKFDVATDFEIKDEVGTGVVESASKTILVGTEDTGSKATFTLNGGTIKALTGDYAVSADGKKDGDYPTVEINKGSLIGVKGNAVRIKRGKATFGNEEIPGEIEVTAGEEGGYFMFTSTDADVTINKGTYTYNGSEASTKRFFYFGDASSKITFNGGIFKSENSALFAFYKVTSNPTIIITGGKFSWKDTGAPFVQDACTKASVSGGYFSSAVLERCLAPGYICVETTEEEGYTHKVIENIDKNIIQVGDIKFETIADAVEEANKATSATTITMLQDVDIETAIKFTTSAPLTLDLNGCSITAANTTTATPAIQMDEDVVNLSIVDNSENADGSIDQKFDGAAYTIIVNSGTLNVKSGTICNSSSTGNGRYALKLGGIQGKAAPIVNVSGGYVYGGRAIANGSGIAGITTVLNITGGKIEGKHGTKDYQYATLAFPEEYAKCVITGGMIISNANPCIYNGKKQNVEIIIGSATEPTKCPYFYTQSADWCIRTGSDDASKRVWLYNCYCNNKTLKYLETFNTGASSHNLDPKEKDAEGREYDYRFYVDNDENIIKVGEDKFETIAAAVTAINAATTEVEVQFLKDVNLDQEIVLNNANAKIVIDLNGKTIKAQKAAVSAIVVEGANTEVDFVDKVGGGIIDHTYTSTAYTLTVKSGTVNLISANISNMTGTGYGRNAVRVLADGANAYFNMTGGVVRGGRGIRVGGASETAKAYVTISGGFVEGRNDDDTKYYSAISTEAGYSYVLINGGTIKGNGAKSVIYCNGEYAETSTIIINKNEATGTIPYLYSNGSQYVVAAGGSADMGKLVYTGSWNYYTNKTSNSWIGSTLTKEVLDPKIKDEYGYEYTHRCYKNVN